ncbi:MAG: PTS fructose transporter subunit IIA [Thiobacillaceae bacterium]
MIGILVVAHGTLAESLVECATHVLGQRPTGLATLDFMGHADPDERTAILQARIAELDQGGGVLVLADIYGATPCNTLCRLLAPDHVEGVTGVNLPMLLKALNYRNSMPLLQLVERIVNGGRASIDHISETMCNAAKGN